MKKLALVLSFVFCAAMIAPAFAADPPVKPAAKTECTKDAKACVTDGKTCTKEGAACCKAGAPAPKDGKATVQAKK